MVEVGQGVGAVHDQGDAVASGHGVELPDREDLAREVDHVTGQDDPGPRGDGLLEETDDLRRILGGNGYPDLAQHDPLATLPLTERRDHARIVLGAGEDLVSPLEVDPQLHGLQALRRVPGERHLLGMHAPLPGHARPHPLPLRLENAPHRVRGCQVRVVQVPFHGLLDPSRGRADATVVEVDQRPIHREGPADLEPEVLVTGHLGRCARMSSQVGRDVAGRRAEQGGPDSDPQGRRGCRQSARA